MMGRWIRGSGWYPNFRQPQLFRKGSIRYTLEPVHEGFEVVGGGSVGTLRNAVWQFPFRNLEEVINKMNWYSTLGATKLASKRVSMASAFGHAVWSFIKHYIFKLGFIDGWAGFVIAFGNFEVHFTATRSGMKRHKRGSPRPASRSNAFLSARLLVRACVQPSRSSNGQERDRSRPLRRQAPQRFRGRPLGRGYNRHP